MIDCIMFYHNSIIVLSSLPLKFHNLRILCFSDWQGNLSANFLLSILEKIERPDFLIFAGDGMCGRYTGGVLGGIAEDLHIIKLMLTNFLFDPTV